MFPNYEVNIVIKKGTKVKELIQICYDPTSGTAEEREVKAYLMGSKELKCKNLLVVTWDHEDEKEVKGEKIRFIPLWKWLLKKT